MSSQVYSKNNIQIYYTFIIERYLILCEAAFIKRFCILLSKNISGSRVLSDAAGGLMLSSNNSFDFLGNYLLLPLSVGKYLRKMC